MKKILIGVGIILGMASCTKQQDILEHNSYISVSTHNQTRMIAYVVNIATIPGIESINCDYSFYAMSGGNKICCNVVSDTFDDKVSVDLTHIGFMDSVDGFYVEVNNTTYELDVEQIY